MEVGLSPGDFLLDGDPAPSPKGGRNPTIFGPCLLWPSAWIDHDATWYGGRPWPRRHCVRWGRTSPKMQQPQFSAHVYCGQTAVCIRIPLGTEIGLSLSDIVLDGDPAPLHKGAQPPIVCQYPLWPNGWMDQDVTWYGGKSRSRRLCVRLGRSCFRPKRGPAPSFRLVSIVAKRLDG